MRICSAPHPSRAVRFRAGAISKSRTPRLISPPRKAAPICRSICAGNWWSWEPGRALAQRFGRSRTEPVNIFFVVIKPKADAQHIVACVGDDIGLEEAGLPLRCARMAKRDEARLRTAGVGLQQIRLAQYAGFARLDCVREFSAQRRQP